MTSFCNFDNIYWINPFTRWFFEALCGQGGTVLVVLVVLITIVYFLAKLSQK